MSEFVHINKIYNLEAEVTIVCDGLAIAPNTPRCSKKPKEAQRSTNVFKYSIMNTKTRRKRHKPTVNNKETQNNSVHMNQGDQYQQTIVFSDGIRYPRGAKSNKEQSNGAQRIPKKRKGTQRSPNMPKDTHML